MLVLFETAAGYSLFKVTDEKKLTKTDADDVHDAFFTSSQDAQRLLELASFEPFDDTADAVAAVTSAATGKASASLTKFLKRKMKKLGDATIAVQDKAMAVSIKDELTDSSSATLKVVNDTKTQELYRGIRQYIEELLGKSGDGDGDDGVVTGHDLKAMQLGLSHSLSRYKLKFSADKVDTMIIQAVGLLDELDKEINTYAMRVKEWYGWHFPELQGLITTSTVGDRANAVYAQLVLACGLRPNYRSTDLSAIIEDETLQKTVKETAEISMGTEIADLDVINIQALAEQVMSLTEYRTQLFEYLKNRMNAIAPNLTVLVGELVGARLISHAGSLMNLAKQPASTVQILGAEKALFRALKTKHDTPKYGLIYHASLVGQAAPKNKGKISRVLAAKSALAIRVDALTEQHTGGGSDDDSDGGIHQLDTTVGYEGRAKVEARLRQLEGGLVIKSTAKAQKVSKYDPVAAKSANKAAQYNAASDMVLDTTGKNGDDADEKKKAKKEKKKKKRKAEENGDDNADDDDDEAKKKKKDKKKKKRKAEDADEEGSDGQDASAKKKAKKAKKDKRKSG